MHELDIVNGFESLVGHRVVCFLLVVVVLFAPLLGVAWIGMVNRFPCFAVDPKVLNSGIAIEESQK
jgi:hypothetical protein